MKNTPYGIERARSYWDVRQKKEEYSRAVHLQNQTTTFLHFNFISNPDYDTILMGVFYISGDLYMFLPYLRWCWHHPFMMNENPGIT